MVTLLAALCHKDSHPWRHPTGPAALTSLALVKATPENAYLSTTRVTPWLSFSLINGLKQKVLLSHGPGLPAPELLCLNHSGDTTRQLRNHAMKGFGAVTCNTISIQKALTSPLEDATQVLPVQPNMRKTRPLQNSKHNR